MLAKHIKKKIAERISPQRVVLTSFAVNFLDIALGLGVAVVTGSVVMIAQALQGVADLFASSFVIIGLTQSRRPPDETHPFGYGREIYFWTLLAGFLMITVTAGLSIYFGWQRVQGPEPITNLPLALGVLLLGMLTNGYSLSLSLRRMLGHHPVRQLFHAFYQSPLVEAKTTFVLDLMGSVAAVLGFLSLLAFGATGNGFFDGIGAILIGIAVAVLAGFLLIGLRALVIGKSAVPKIEDQIREAALTVPEVTDVLRLRTMHGGIGKLFIHLDVHVKHGLRTEQIERIIDEIKRNIREEVPIAETVQVELETPKKELQHVRSRA